MGIPRATKGFNTKKVDLGGGYPPSIPDAASCTGTQRRLR